MKPIPKNRIVQMNLGSAAGEKIVAPIWLGVTRSDDGRVSICLKGDKLTGLSVTGMQNRHSVDYLVQSFDLKRRADISIS